jgi:hypothetical protein
MNEHPSDSLPALALGALDTEEASQVIAHVSACPSCRDDAQAWEAIVAMLPYAPLPCDPPERVRQRLFALVGATEAQFRAARSRRRMGSMPGWLIVAGVAPLMVLVFVFASLMRAEQGRADTLANQLDQNHQMMAFISAPMTTPQPLKARDAGTHAIMYTQPGQRRALLVVSGLKPAYAGKTYRCWFATADRKVPSGTFDVDENGASASFVDAPESVDSYGQFMVTDEHSSEVVLSAPR